MRLWSLHPSLLDRRGLVACWRESLLAQKVLRGATKGYTRHPQLTRFRRMANPNAAIGTYLWALADAADDRGFTFNRTLVLVPPPGVTAPVPVAPDGTEPAPAVLGATGTAGATGATGLASSGPSHPAEAAQRAPRMTVTSGQIDHEWAHLLAKTASRDTDWHRFLSAAERVPHPMFDVVPGPVEEWEILGD